MSRNIDEAKFSALSFYNKQGRDLSTYDFKAESAISIQNCVNYLSRTSGQMLDINNCFWGNIIRFKAWKWWKDLYPKSEQKQEDKNPVDCDKNPHVLELFCALLDNSVVKVSQYKGRYIILDTGKDTKIVETETINSLEAILNAFIRHIVFKLWGKTLASLCRNGQSIKNGKIVACRTQQTAMDRDAWIILNLNEIHQALVDQDLEQELKEFSLLNEFAQFVHSIGNFCFLPYGANFDSPIAKSKCLHAGTLYGCQIKDDIFAFVGRLKSDSRYLSWRKEIEEYKDIELMGSYFNDNQNAIGNTEEEKYLNLRLKLIRERGEELNSRFSEIL